MTKTGTNLLGIFITILAGTYFYNSYCSICAVEKKRGEFSTSVVSRSTPEPVGKFINLQTGKVSFFRRQSTLLVAVPGPVELVPPANQPGSDLPHFTGHSFDRRHYKLHQCIGGALQMDQVP